MKLSIAWIFDHIDADWKKIDIEVLVRKCIQTTAEIEGFYKVSADIDEYTLAQITNSADVATALSPEWNKEISLPKRADAVVGKWYLIKKDGTWASMKDFGSDKEHLMPALSCAESLRNGAWKKTFEAEDYILELDNKSITHRPDLWSHRGFAREIAAIFNLRFKTLHDFVVEIPVKDYEAEAPATEHHPFNLINKAPKACRRIAGLSLTQVQNQPSQLFMAHRLARVGSRAIDAIVDTTNYVMLDIGQPMHAFDADALAAKTVMVRFAQEKEALTLLDGSKLSLTSHDVVIADKEKALGLAGIMGGAQSGVNAKTTAVFLESANFDATTIRLSATRHKLRTEASARFEKSLDPNQNTIALLRAIKVLQDLGVPFKASDEIASVGTRLEEPIITVSHDFIERRLGVKLDISYVLTTLAALSFMAQYDDGNYTIVVPTFRATKDIRIKEDIVEEIGRYVGYSTIERIMPAKELQTSDLTPVMRLRVIKRIMASTLDMRELYNYAFFDEEFLRKLQWDPGHTLTVQSPVSEHWRRLVTTLVPNLLKVIHNNAADNHELRFFEWARTWHLADDVQITEQKKLTGILFDSKKPVDFYAAKALLQHLFDALHMKVSWHKVDEPEQPWFRAYQTADLKHDGKTIGRVGNVNQLFLKNIAEGDAFIFELDGDYLEKYKHEFKKVAVLSKYPEVVRDISMLIPLERTADEVAHAIMKSDNRIVSALLVDFFEKDDWADKRSLTFRSTIQDANKTLTKEEVDTIMERVIESLGTLGATIR